MFGWIKKLFGVENKPDTLVLTNEQKVEETPAQPVEFHIDRAKVALDRAKEISKPKAAPKKKAPAKAKAQPKKAAPKAKKAKVEKVDFDAMTKAQIDAYASERGIKLDGRKKKQTMIEELKTQLKEK
jgi:hypothetical protein